MLLATGALTSVLQAHGPVLAAARASLAADLAALAPADAARHLADGLHHDLLALPDGATLAAGLLGPLEALDPVTQRELLLDIVSCYAVFGASPDAATLLTAATTAPSSTAPAP